ncbi:uncharacterized protein LOC108678149, partial [Hyalella azteca]|uniref:Uncharacterized protein LOC108678149 n=1 Tax=Hyalella azteca TaxID=294128 RepID=A0A8B7P7G3_HYAAZ
MSGGYLTVRLALSHGVNGIGVWSVDTDDFRGVCGTGKYPLLSAINRVLQENSIPDKKRPVMPSSTTERNVPTMPRPVSGCSVVATSNVSLAVLSCGSLNEDPAECDAGDTVPPQSVVLATCWETADMTVRCHDDGFWRPFVQEDGWLEKKMAILCQPYYLNSEVCGRRTSYASTGAALNTQDFDRPRNRWPWVASLLRAHCVTRTPETSTEAMETARLKVEVGAAHSRLEVTEQIQMRVNYLTYAENLKNFLHG